MNPGLTTRSKWGFVFGAIIGTAFFFIVPSPIVGLILGTITAVVVTRPVEKQFGTKYGAVAGGIILSVFVFLQEIGAIDHWSEISFIFIDHVLYLLLTGGIASALIGAFIGRVLAKQFARNGKIVEKET